LCVAHKFGCGFAENNCFKGHNNMRLNRRWYNLTLSLLAAAFWLSLATDIHAQTAPAVIKFDKPDFQKLWEYSDRLLAEQGGNAGRSYTWGPAPLGIAREHYEFDTISGVERNVQYFDKGRMEFNSQDYGSSGTVSAGLLVVELVSGNLQVGDSLFERRKPADVQVAGDENRGGRNPNAPTYASFSKLATFAPGQNRATDQTGQTVRQSLTKEGQVTSLANPPADIRIAYYEPAIGHNVAQVFADYQKLSGQVWNGKQYVAGPVFTDNPLVNVFGYPIAEPYWTRAEVGGVEKDVLVQLFERRILTYTPANADPFKVEMGNLGQHYYQWRYKSPPVVPPLRLTPKLETPTLPGHYNTEIRNLSYAADGKTLYTTGDDYTIRRWDAQTGQQLWAAPVKDSSLFRLALSADGKWLATDYYYGFYLWDAATGQLKATVRTIFQGFGLLWALAISPDSKVIAASDDSGNIRLFDLATQQPLRTIQTTTPSDDPKTGVDEFFGTFIFTPDNKHLIASKRDFTGVWEVATGKQIADLKFAPRYMALSPDGKLIAGGERQLEIWNWAENRSVKKFGSANGDLTVPAFSPDGKRITAGTGRYGGEVLVWEVEGAKTDLVFSLRPPNVQYGIKAVAFSPDGQIIASAGLENRIRFWNALNGQEIRVFGKNENSVSAIAASPDNKTFVVGTSGGAIRLMNRTDGQEIGLLKSHQESVNALVYSPDGTLLASGGGSTDTIGSPRQKYDNAVRVWEVATGKLLYTFDNPASNIEMLTFSPNGQILAAASGGSVYLWDVVTGDRYPSLRSPGTEILSLAFSPDGRQIALGAGGYFSDGRHPIWLMDIANGNLVKTFRGQASEDISRLFFSSDGQLLYSGGSYYSMRVWRVSDAKPLSGIYASGLTMTPTTDKSKLAVSSYSGVIRLFDTATGAELAQSSSVDAGSYPRLAFSPDGTLISGHRDGSLRIWQP
jgi:WD40 repeat protein